MHEYSSPTDEFIRNEVIPSGRPAVLRGLVRHWPAVAAAKTPTGALEYLRRFDNGTPVDAIMLPPEVEGRVFYNDTFTGFNFIRNRLSVGAVAGQVMRYAAFPRAPAVAAQSALVRDCLPGFAAENFLTVLDADVLPRIWLGNAITTPTHLDEWNNICCVVAGRRRFTLFPPEQIANLYVGPIDFAPTGAPISLVSMHAPDFGRYPRFREALAAAVGVEVEAGDAVFIPPLWWHHVESLAPFNVLVNYWWHAMSGASVGSSGAFETLVHALLTIRHLPPPTREAWCALFDHYVFGDPRAAASHMPPHCVGVLSRLSESDAARVRGFLSRRLSPTDGG